MKQMICLSQSGWRSVPTRTQQLMSRMKEVEVLFFEPSPSPLGRDRRKKAYKQEGRQVRPNMTVYTLPPVIPVLDNHPRLHRANQKKVARYIQKRMDQHRFQEPLLWLCSPVNHGLPDLLPHRGLVYDCDQDWSHLPILWESQLAYNADVIFAASPGLVEHLSPCNTNIALIPNGVNFPMFSRTEDTDLAFPGDLVAVKNPILGYSGTIWDDLDLAPVEYAARMHPEWSFVFVGRVRNNPMAASLGRLHNVYFLGHKPLPEVPEYVARFDVCLSLLRTGMEDNDVLSTRIYEYLSTGLPIVSMFSPEQVEEYPDVIYGARGPAEFTDLCARALGERSDWLRRRRRDYGAAAAWNGRTAEILRILETNGLL